MKNLPLRPIADAIDLINQDYEAHEKILQEANVNGINTLLFDKMKPFANHPFRLYEGQRLDDMVESIKDNGILTPMIVRKLEEDTYEMLAGHNRMNAAKLAGLTEGPVIIKENLSDEEALIYVIETNLMQRSFSDLRTSEKAMVLYLKHNSTASQGKRNDIIDELKKLENPGYIKESKTCSQVGNKLKNLDKVGEEYGLSKNSIARLLRVHELINGLKIRTDNGEIALCSAVDISYLTQEQQSWIEGVLAENDYKLDMKKAQCLRANSDKKNFDKEMIYQILSGEYNKKPKSKTPQPFKIKPKIYTKFFAPDTKQSEMEEVIEKALELYFAMGKGG